MAANLSKLQGTLLTSGIQKDNPALYQVINEILKNLRDLQSSTGTSTGTGTTTTVVINGSPGPPGIDGNDGEDGLIGAPGARGIDGAVGTAGAAGPITIGPMGLDGQDGEDGMPIPGNAGSPGASGATGPTGAAGPVTLGPMGMDGQDGEDGQTIPGPAGPAGSSDLTTVRTTSNQTINAGAGTFVDVTSLSFPVVNGGRYSFHFYIALRSAATTTGWKVDMNGPTGTIDKFHTYQTVLSSDTGGVQTWLQFHSAAWQGMTTLTATITANVDMLIMIEGRFLATANGTVTVQAANELAANTDITIREGSWGYYF